MAPHQDRPGDDLPGDDVTGKIRADMRGVRHRYVETRGLRLHIAEAGEGPLVVLLHGFPELSLIHI